MTSTDQPLSRYEILDKIGEGGMGEVFLARDTTLERRVALKFLPEQLQKDETSRKRFLLEAKSAAALDHPYICKIYEIGDLDGRSFIAMEYVEGETLARRLQKAAPCRPRRACASRPRSSKRSRRRTPRALCTAT